MQNRRQFIKNLVRGGILASLALLSGIFIRRWYEAESCQRSLACEMCNLADRCTLPEAEKYRIEKPGSEKTLTENGTN